MSFAGACLLMINYSTFALTKGYTWGTVNASNFWRFQTKSDGSFLTFVECVVKEREVFDGFSLRGFFHPKKDLYQCPKLVGSFIISLEAVTFVSMKGIEHTNRRQTDRFQLVDCLVHPQIL
jgi:hypothetical protein